MLADPLEMIVTSVKASGSQSAADNSFSLNVNLR